MEFNLKDRFFIIGLILTLVQFYIFIAKLDHLITIGPFRTHHILELPAALFIGLWAGKMVMVNRLDLLKAQMIHHALYLVVLLIQPLRGVTSIAGFKVTFPELIGFYLALMMYQPRLQASASSSSNSLQ